MENIVSGIAWLSAGRMVAMLLSFVSTAVLARLLSPADFGMIAAAMIVVELSGVIFEGAFGIGIVQRHELSDRCASNTLWLSVIVGLIFMILTMLCSSFVQNFFNFPFLESVLLVSSLSLFFKALGNVSSALLRRKGSFRILAIINVGCYLFSYGPIAIVMAWNGYGVWSLVMGSISATALESLFSFAYAKVSMKRPPSYQEAKEVFSVSGYFTLTQTLNWAARTGANIVVGRMLGAESLGFYSRGWKLLEVVTNATATPLHSVLLPAFSRMQHDPNKARKALIKALTVAVPVFSVISVFAIVHSKAIVLIALGSKWTEVVPVAQFLFLALVPRCCYKITESVTFGFGRSGITMMTQGLYAVLMVGGAVLGVHNGAVGVAFYISLAVSLFYVCSLLFASRIVQARFIEITVIHLKAIFVALCVTLLDVGIMSLFPEHMFWIREIVGCGLSLIAVICSFVYLPESFVGNVFASLRSDGIDKFKQRLRR